ncbi:hypothetical protein MUK42_25012 [Musa troglodytarum]|uniref:Uncharacterized protein n=1 Tax=Musa troglodytarum TaxID=320322 RepID=A0A9E7JYL3_9LILI|nr:hypothetical protein MUK42_25012 [Musa troglodytarum]
MRGRRGPLDGHRRQGVARATLARKSGRRRGPWEPTRRWTVAEAPGLGGTWAYSYAAGALGSSEGVGPFPFVSRARWPACLLVLSSSFEGVLGRQVLKGLPARSNVCKL